MNALLTTDFITHYSAAYTGLKNHKPAVGNLLQTNDAHFEIEDANKGPQLVTPGTAVYQNANRYAIKIIGYETFIQSLPSPPFKQGRKNCDLIVHTTNNNNQYFLLNELTSTPAEFVKPFQDRKGPQPGKRQRAKNQLLDSLQTLMNVPSIKKFINTFTDKRCCFFNKQANPPSQIITATTAFNALNALTSGGLQMPYPDIETEGFSYWEYSDRKPLVLN